jgi:tRNA(Ile)-lysidine synthase
LLPYVEQHFNPSARRALARTADMARVDDDWLARMTAAAGVGVIDYESGKVIVDIERLRALPEALQRRLVVDALTIGHSRAATYEDVTRFLDRMEHFRRKVVLVPSRTGRNPVPAPSAPFCFELPVPGVVRTGAGWAVEAEPFDHPQDRLVQLDVVQIDATTVQGALSVRSRRAGDRVQPVGLGGSKKVQDVLVDRKVDRHDRDAVPIVTDSTGRIVWVAGHVLGEAFRVTDRTKGVIILKLRRI